MPPPNESPNEVELVIKWRNNDFFELREKPKAEDPITVIRVEENGDFPRQRASIRSIALDCLTRRLDEALNEMVG